MAEVIGYLKEDATSGEERVLKALSHALPPDFQVYVECPLHHRGMERMPDFIVLTTFGVVVLEVKDWVEVLEADKFYAKIRSRQGTVYRKKSPVRQARRFAEILAGKLQDTPELMDRKRRLKIPWGYAVVFPNLKSAPITQLRRPWGETYVLGMGDLQPHVVTRCLKATLPFDYDLRRTDLKCIRGVVNPSVSVTIEVSEEKTRTVTLDEVQETIVAERPRAAVRPEKPRLPDVAARQAPLMSRPAPAEEPQPGEDAGATPPDVEMMVHNYSIRLVRGVAGSGKTLVLMQRARYLAAQHPKWKICVITYNKRLTDILQANLKGISCVKVTNFDKLCAVLLRQSRPWRSPQDPPGWIRNHADQWPMVAELGVRFISDEIKWIKEVGLKTRADYLEIERRGRGQERKLRRSGRRRQQIYDVLKAYNAWLAEQDTYDWADVPHLVLKGLDSGAIQPERYDAILIDEAQDFAPSWIKVVKRLFKLDGGLVFMADDPSQSIYRYYSWREKGIPVVGRTRWLRIPYRNTREIYQAAYEVIHEDEILKQSLRDQLGMAVEPDLSSEYLRSGPRPQLREFGAAEDEFAFIKSEIEWLLQQGCDAREIAVLHRRRRGVGKLQRALRGTGVTVSTFHGPKGLEFEVAFLSQMQYTFPQGMERSERALSEERRLVYMAMTRARERLYVSYEDRLPAAMSGACDHLERVLA